MLKENKFIYSLVAVTSILVLQGCGDSYPELGKFRSASTLPVNKLSQHSAIYPIDSSTLESWKNEANRVKNVSELNDNEIMELRDQYSQSAIIQKFFPNSKGLTEKDFDIDKFVDDTYSERTSQTQEINARIESANNNIASLLEFKAQSEAALMKLNEIKAGYEEEEVALKKDYERLATESGKIFASFNSRDYGRSFNLAENVAKGNKFSYRVHKDTSMTCQEFLMSGQRDKEKVMSYVFSPSITFKDKAFCPYFEMIGRTTKHKQKARSQLSEDQINTLSQAATAAIKKNKMSRILRAKQSNVYRDNPELTTTAKAFGRSEKSRVQSLNNMIKSGENSLQELAKITKEDIKSELVKSMARAIGRAKDLYLLGELHNKLTKESSIQPDGMFTLKSGEDFYLVEIDASSSANPAMSKYAVIRMEQFKNKDMVTLTSNEFFSLSDLENISL
jgi:hypothetical protein